MKYTQDISESVKQATNKLVDFIKPTFGPNGKGIIIRNGSDFISVDDGVAVAKEFLLDDPFENAIVSFIKKAAIKTNDRVGDGTTGSLIILQDIINRDNVDIKELELSLAVFKEEIKKQSKKIEGKEDLMKIAYNSFNNSKIAYIVSEVVHRVGIDGIVSVEDSDAVDTTFEVKEGMELNSGYISGRLVNDSIKDRIVLENVYILIIDRVIKKVDELYELSASVSAKEGTLLVIAEDVQDEALGLLILNKVRGNMYSGAVRLPGFGDVKEKFMGDLMALTGVKVVGGEITVDSLGRADKVIITKDDTVILGAKGNDEEIQTRIKSIKNEIIMEKDVYHREKAKERLAKLSSGVAVIKVGAATESEADNLKYKVEDAVNATQSALRSGYVKGAGITLARINTGSILDESLKAPMRKLIESGVDIEKVSDTIIDPTEVLIAQVESAISIAKVLKNSSGILL